MKTDEDEDDAVEQVDDHLPEGLGLKADTGDHDFRRFPAEIETGGDDGEDAGNVARFGSEIAAEGGEERDGKNNLRAVIHDTSANQVDDVGDNESDSNSANCNVDKCSRQPGASDQRHSGGCDDEGNFEGDKAGRIIDEAFSLQNGDDTAREAKTLGNGGGGDGIGRRNDGSKNKTGGKRKTGDEGVGNVGNGNGSGKDEADGEEGDRAQFATEIAPGGVEGLDVE